MQVKRCAQLFVELDQQPRFDLGDLLSGGAGLDRSVRWNAHAPHLPEPVPVSLAQLAILERFAAGESMALTELTVDYPLRDVEGLLAAGLLLDAAEEETRPSLCDAATRDVAWWPPALLGQVHGAWSGVDIESRYEAGLMPDIQKMVEVNGEPPAHEHRRGGDVCVKALAAPEARPFDELLGARKTCRNFDGGAELSSPDLATMLYRVWAATGTYEIAPGAIAVRKSSPGGGGLHGTEAYLLVQRAEGLQPGLYHYLALEHALEPLRLMDADEAAKLAHRFVAGQHWFANVPVMVIMVYRFDRLFWKYRRHSKAWRVAHLDIGHLSQTMYLSAADLGLGAFVTAAINDRDIDAELELPPLREASIAIVGFGPRAAEKINIELDNLTPTPASLR